MSGASGGPQRMRCERRVDPIGIGTARPWLSWAMAPDPARREQRQTAYQVIVEDSRGGVVWDSGVVQAEAAGAVQFGGEPLRSRQRCSWRVRVWDEEGVVSALSAPGTFETGLLEPEDWSAGWLTAEFPDLGGRPQPCAYLRAPFELTRAPATARVYVTALGVYELWCNGRRVTDDVLRPGWTEYRKFLPYQTYDLGPFLRPGPNVIGVILGGGWYAGCMGVGGFARRYGDRPQLLAQVELSDGDQRTVLGDDAWRYRFGPLLASDLLMGERYDARLELSGWASPGYDDDAWLRALPGEPYAGRLVGAACEPVRPTEAVAPVALDELGPSRWVVDLGQNIVGWARLRVTGAAGDEVTLRFAEARHPDGSIYTDNLRAADATDQYILRGQGEEVWEPTFTTHGFRYVELSGYPGVPDARSVTGVVARSDLATTGRFECSDELVNHIHRNVVWSQKGNLVELPTDCPQRDERLGWLGDAQVFAPSATYNMDVGAFLAKWMDDVVVAQADDGAVPDVAPLSFVDGDGAAGWADAIVIVPWVLYERYGDRRILETHFDAMCRWLDFLDVHNPSHLWLCRRGNDYGDHLPAGPPTPNDLVASAYFAHSAQLVARAARVLGRDDDAKRYEKLHLAVSDAFVAAYVGTDGSVTGERQGGYALALAFGLVPTDRRAAAATRLVADIEARGDHLATGFLGTAVLLPVLTEAGHLDVAYRLLRQQSWPSWGFTIRNGATTIWEFWDAWTEEAGFRVDPMSSHNHYSLGAVDQWLYASVAGLDVDPAGAGYARAVVAPRPGGGLRWASASHDTVRGRFEVAWRRDENRFALDLTVPPDATATVVLPVAPRARITEGETVLDGTVHEVGSGRYEFTATWSTP